MSGLNHTRECLVSPVIKLCISDGDQRACCLENYDLSVASYARPVPQTSTPRLTMLQRHLVRCKLFRFLMNSVIPIAEVGSNFVSRFRLMHRDRFNRLCPNKRHNQPIVRACLIARVTLIKHYDEANRAEQSDKSE